MSDLNTEGDGDLGWQFGRGCLAGDKRSAKLFRLVGLGSAGPERGSAGREAAVTI